MTPLNFNCLCLYALIPANNNLKSRLRSREFARSLDLRLLLAGYCCLFIENVNFQPQLSDINARYNNTETVFEL